MNGEFERWLQQEDLEAELREELLAIQKDEQEHGKQISDYMSTNNMYS